MTSKTSDAADGDFGEESNVAMGGLIIRWCSRCERDGGGDARTVDVDVDVSCT